MELKSNWHEFSTDGPPLLSNHTLLGLKAAHYAGDESSFGLILGSVGRSAPAGSLWQDLDVLIMR